MVNSNKNRFIKIFSLFIVYYVINWIIGGIIILTINGNYNWANLITGGRDWWYFWSIMLVYLIAPILNSIFKLYELKQIIVVIALFYTLLLVFDGTFLPIFTFHADNFFYLILIYMIGGIIKKIEFIILNKKFLLLTIICLFIIILFVNMFYIFAHINFSKMLFFQTSPFAIIISIALFTLFFNINFQSKIINFLAISTFSIYLFHSWFEQGLQLMWIQKNKNFFPITIEILITWLLTVLLTFIFALIIHYPVKNISLKIEKLLLYLFPLLNKIGRKRL